MSSLPVCLVTGRVRASLVHPDGIWTPVTPFRPNLVLYDWAAIVGELLRGAPSGKPYKIGGMYLEFANSAVAVTPPSFGRSGGKNYFDDLLTDPSQDYLRVPLTAATLLSTDDDLFPAGNEVTFYSQSQGTVGVHGKAFSDAADSRVIGAALVAYPQFSDETQDLVFSRFYFAMADQVPKQAGSQIGITWPLTLE